MVGRNSPESPNPLWPDDDAPAENVLVPAGLLTSYGADDSLRFSPRLPSGRLAAWLSFGAAGARCIPAVAVAQP
jgi:hypothetical protein